MTDDPDPAPSTPGRARLSWRSAAFVVVGNLIPILGVVVLGWNAVQILLLYWCETVLIGVFTLPRIVTAQVVIPTRPSPGDGIVIPLNAPGGRLMLAGFFVVHYGIFCLAHAFFTTLLIADRARHWSDTWRDVFADRDFRIAILSLVAVHLVLQFKDWWLPRAWRRSDPGAEMMKPYGRVLIMHMTVIMGGWFAGGAGASRALVLVLCIIKTIAEILALRRRQPEPDVEAA